MTFYYPLVKPLTAVKVEAGPLYDTVTVWESKAGMASGSIRVQSGNGMALAFRFFDRNRPAARKFSGGHLADFQNLPGETYVIADDGTITTMQDLRRGLT